MRITGGQFVRAVISRPAGNTTRPETERVRTSIFNVLGNDLDDLTVLDLYAGSGSLGLEALSRGAKSVTFVDRGKTAVSTIKSNIEKLNVADSCQVMTVDIMTAIKQLRGQGAQFNLVFIDPPYVNFELAVVEVVSELLAAGGVIIVSAFHKTELPENISGLKYIKNKLFGNTTIYFYQRV